MLLQHAAAAMNTLVYDSCWPSSNVDAEHQQRFGIIAGCPASCSSARASSPTASTSAPTSVQTIFGTCTWGNCCGAGCDCSEGSDAKDRLDRACRAHDVCYGALLMLCYRPASGCSAQHRCLAPRRLIGACPCCIHLGTAVTCKPQLSNALMPLWHLNWASGGEDWKDCDAICRCDRELAEKADEVRFGAGAECRERE